MDTHGQWFDLTRIEREIQKCTDVNTARALRAVLDAMRMNRLRIDALEAWRESLESKPGALDGHGGGARDRG